MPLFKTKDQDIQQKHIQRLKQMKSSDLPTPITCKSGGFEKKPRKTGRLRPQTWRRDMRQIKTTMRDYLF